MWISEGRVRNSECEDVDCVDGFNGDVGCLAVGGSEDMLGWELLVLRSCVDFLAWYEEVVDALSCQIDILEEANPCFTMEIDSDHKPDGSVEE